MEALGARFAAARIVSMRRGSVQLAMCLARVRMRSCAHNEASNFLADAGHRSLHLPDVMACGSAPAGIGLRARASGSAPAHVRASASPCSERGPSAVGTFSLTHDRNRRHQTANKQGAQAWEQLHACKPPERHGSRLSGARTMPERLPSRSRERVRVAPEWRPDSRCGSRARAHTGARARG